MSNSVLVEERGTALMVRFNRPEIRSPLSVHVLEHLSDIVERVGNRDDVERLIFTGVGDVFASGADLCEIAEVGSDEAREFAERGQNLMRRISSLRIITIAAI